MLRKKTLTKPEQARQVKLLTAMGERLTRDNVIMFIAGVTPKVQVYNRLTLREKRLNRRQVRLRLLRFRPMRQLHRQAL